MLASYSRLEPQPSNSPLAEGLHVMRRGKLTASSNTLFAAPFYLTWFYYISDGFNIPTQYMGFDDFCLIRLKRTAKIISPKFWKHLYNLKGEKRRSLRSSK